MTMTGLIRLRCACPEAGIARAIACAAVEARLAASVSVSAPVSSVYRWQGAVHEATEVVLEATTLIARVEALCALIRSMHPYHTPAISWWPCARDAATARWVQEATAAQTGDGPAD
jgi:periplasmic divalent cation tolerance protein